MINVVIVEGIDRVGKTTLINLLKSKLKEQNTQVAIFKDRFLYNEVSMNSSNEKLLTSFNFLKSLNDTNVTVIFDRFHLSEFVYGKFSRGYENGFVFDFDKMLEIEFRPTLILVQATDIERSIKEHGSDLKGHNKCFIESFEESVIRRKYVCTYNTIQGIIDTILNQKERS